MRYWSNALLGLGIALIAAVVIKFDWHGAIAGTISLLLGFPLHLLASRSEKEKI